MLTVSAGYEFAHRDDYATAYAGFQWPKLERFNWALDYFDSIARDNPALYRVMYDATRDKDYFEKRGLQRYAGVWSLWALGVGAVISGHYSGWNFGLSAGFGGMLINGFSPTKDGSTAFGNMGRSVNRLFG